MHLKQMPVKNETGIVVGTRSEHSNKSLNPNFVRPVPCLEDLQSRRSSTKTRPDEQQNHHGAFQMLHMRGNGSA
jgi:hypothetical protein